MTKKQTDSVAVLIASFKTFLEAYDRDCPFTRHGQLQYHIETIRLRRRLGSAKAALMDDGFQCALYKTLQAWGIGSRASSLRPFPDFVVALHAKTATIEELDGLAIDQPALEVSTVGNTPRSSSYALFGGLARPCPKRWYLRPLQPALLVQRLWGQ